MDDAQLVCALDLSGRPFLVWNVDFPTQKIGIFDTELVREFFQAISTHGGITLHMDRVHGVNSHHYCRSPRSRRWPARCAWRWKQTRGRRMRSHPPRAHCEAVMLTVLVDYDSGNLHSAQKGVRAYGRRSGAAAPVIVTSRPEDVARADRVVLPGDGAFPACRHALGRSPMA